MSIENIRFVNLFSRTEDERNFYVALEEQSCEASTVIFYDNTKERSNAAIFVENLLPPGLRGLHDGVQQACFEY